MIRRIGFGLDDGPDVLAPPTQRRKRIRPAVKPVFKPRGATPVERLASVVQQARERPLAFAAANFDDDVWEVTESDAEGLGGPGWKGRRWIRFTPTTKFAGLGLPMPAAVCEFAKAYLRRMPVTTMSILTARRNAIAWIGLELEGQGLKSLAECTPAVLEGAVDRARAKLANSSIVDIGIQIQLVAEVINENRLSGVPLAEWTPCEPTMTQIGDTSTSAVIEAALMPGPNYVRDLAIAYGRSRNIDDILVTSALTIQLCSWGQRIGSVLKLEEDCDVGQDDGEHLALVWPPFKGNDAVVVDLADQLAPIVRQALRRVRAATAEGRAIKRWYDQNPSMIRLPPQLEHVRLRGWLNREEACALTGLSADALPALLKANSVSFDSNGQGAFSRNIRISLSDLEYMYLSRLPMRMRDAGGTKAHPLFVVGEREFFRNKSTGSLAMFEIMKYNQIQSRLGLTQGRNIWTRTDVERPRGSDKTHAVRHWIATLARARGISDEDLAQLQRRKNPLQNQAYIHLPAQDFGDLAARTASVLASGGDPCNTPLASAPSANLISHIAGLVDEQGLETDYAP